MVNKKSPPFRNMVGKSQKVVHLKKMIDQVANSDASVLILGDTGTGKEGVAQNIHLRSSRCDQPFIPVNCGAIPEDLLESELFGHERGAFTGAITSRPGRFEMAHKGTVLLDEIGDMSFPMQVKLLRFLQEGTFERVGSTVTKKVNVRILAATHKNLEDSIENGKFREDLFYRINVFPINVPPLCQRTSDIPLLIKAFTAKLEKTKRKSVSFSNSAINELKLYQWPGNIRELANLVERMAILFPGGIIEKDDLPQKYKQDIDTSPDMEFPADIEETVNYNFLSDGVKLKDHLADIEKELIRQAMDECNGVIAQAAKKLGVQRTTLGEKIKKYAL